MIGRDMSRGAIHHWHQSGGACMAPEANLDASVVMAKGEERSGRQRMDLDRN